MKQVTAELAGHLAQENTTLCRALKIVRLDGTIERFTDFDQDFFFPDAGPTTWRPFGPTPPASPWWSIENDAPVTDTFAGIVTGSNITYLPASAPWGASQMFAGYGEIPDAEFLGTPFFTTDYTFETAVSLHADTAGAEGTIRIGLSTGTNWDTVDNYIGFEATKSGSTWGTWHIRMGNGSVQADVDTGIAVGDIIAAGSAGGVRTALQFTVNPDGSNVAWYINGAYVGSESTNIPTAPLGVCVHYTSISFTGTVYFRVEAVSINARVQQGGGTYLAEDGLTFSALEYKSDGSPNNLQATGFLIDSGLSEHDVRARLYDGALFELRVVNWADLTQLELKLISGTVGDITMKNGEFQMELRGLTQYLTTVVGSLYGPLCRAELFGGGAEGIDPSNHWKCRLNRADWVQSGTVLSSPDSVTVVPSPSSALLMIGSSTPADPAPTGWFDDGVIIYTSGALSGYSFEIASWDGAILTLFGGAPMPFTPTAGDTFEIEPGCAKLISVCQSKFDNVLNFAGEPNIPGLNVLSVVGRPQVVTQ